MGDIYHDGKFECQLCLRSSDGVWATYFKRPYTVCMLCDDCHARMKAGKLTEKEYKHIERLIKNIDEQIGAMDDEGKESQPSA